MPTTRTSTRKDSAEIGRDCLAARVRLLNRTITRVYDAALRPQGITVAQLNLLATIANLGPATAHDVSEALSMEISTLSRNARLMEKEGWIEIVPAERGNGIVLSVSRAGLRKLARAKPAWKAAQREARKLLGDDGAALVTQLVNGIWATRRGAPTNGRPSR
jgi:DNA-binding MarR family transcriptional regulator